MIAPRVIGLDLSMTATGVAFPNSETLTIKPQGVGDARLQSIRNALSTMLAAADLAVIEDMPARLQANAAKAVGFVHGAVRTLLLDQKIPYAVIPPATLKAYATGKGNADKTAMAMAAYKRDSAEFDDDNQCDAWWLRAAGLDHLGHPPFPLPAAQRDRLAKVNWPDFGAVPR